MIKTIESEPWRALPPLVADLIEPELEGVTKEILATIAREVPEYARPLEGSFGRGIRNGVGEALSQFVALIRDPDAGRDPGRDVYIALGRGELRQGRTLDSLQAAYRVGARVAWRRLASAGREGGLDVELLSSLAEAIFAYIDELSADSVEGYAEAQSEVDDRRRRSRRELAALLTRETPAEGAEVRSAAKAAGWRPPGRVAAVACQEGDVGRVSRRLPADALATSLDGVGCILFPDADGPGRAANLARAATPGPLAIGPVGPPGQLPESWSLARATLRASQAGALPAEGLLDVDEHLGDLLLFEAGALTRRIEARRLAPLASLTARAGERMRETALAYLSHQGNAAAMARALDVHPQTARYRIARLRELFGSQLEEPAARFEIEAALRAEALRS
jgi:PucR C-terminal helix-turn-helix domain